jgi:hypothetical protein
MKRPARSLKPGLCSVENPKEPFRTLDLLPLGSALDWLRAPLFKSTSASESDVFCVSCACRSLYVSYASWLSSKSHPPTSGTNSDSSVIQSIPARKQVFPPNPCCTSATYPPQKRIRPDESRREEREPPALIRTQPLTLLALDASLKRKEHKNKSLAESST